MSRKYITVALDQIDATFYVRTKLNEDHATQLGLLYEEGVEITPIQIAKNDKGEKPYILVDGRHRMTGMDLAGIKEAKAELMDECEDRAELIFKAFKANVGGSLPPTRADIMFTIQRLLDQGVSWSRLVKELPFPRSINRRYVTDAISALAKSKMNQAVLAVTENDMKLSEAAQRFNVEPDALRAEVSGKRKKKTKENFGLDGLKAGIASQYRSTSGKNAKLLERLLLAYRDDEIHEKTIYGVLDHLEELHGNQGKRIKDWRARFEAIRDEDDSPAPAKANSATAGRMF